MEQNIEYLFDRLKLLDQQVAFSLYNKFNEDIPLTIIQRIIKELESPKYLYNEVKPFKLVNKGGLSSGILNQFNLIYNSIEISNKGVFVFIDKRIECDARFIKVLKTLMKLSIGKDGDLAECIKSIILTLMKSFMINEESIKREFFKDKKTKAVSYHEKILYTAIEGVYK